MEVAVAVAVMLVAILIVRTLKDDCINYEEKHSPSPKERRTIERPLKLIKNEESILFSLRVNAVSSSSPF